MLRATHKADPTGDRPVPPTSLSPTQPDEFPKVWQNTQLPLESPGPTCKWKQCVNNLQRVIEGREGRVTSKWGCLDKVGRTLMIQDSLSLHFQMQEISFFCNRGGQPEPNHHFSSHYSLPPVLTLERNIHTFSLSISTCPSWELRLRNSCFMSLPIFLFLFSLTF